MADYTINDIYQGGVDSFAPTYGDSFTGYHIPAKEVGTVTSVQTANQISEVNNRLNQGIIPIEVGSVDPGIFDQIPKQHFKEMNRMAKLTGAKISVHAPIIEASGISSQGGWNENQRKIAERELKAVVDRTMPLNEKRGASITIHAAKELPGAEFIYGKDGKKETERLIVIDKETGKIASSFEHEERFYPGVVDTKGKITGIPRSPEDQLDTLNRTSWTNSFSEVLHHKQDADERLRTSFRQVEPLWENVIKMTKHKQNPLQIIRPEDRQAYSNVVAGHAFLEDAEHKLTSLFEKAYKFSSEEDKKKLNDASLKYGAMLEKAGVNLEKQSNAMDFMIGELQQIQPKIYDRVENFALEESGKTFGNVAFHAFEEAKKQKMEAPMINIENIFPGMAFSDAKGLKSLIEKSREKFVAAAKQKGYSESEAKAQANKIIGATWDLGHLNQFRKKGYTEEQLAKETEEIAKYVKHVHLTDNFGHSDSHLPPGMGNVPFKAHLEELEKAGVLGDAGKIVEATGWAQHFRTSPHPASLAGLGGEIYSGGPTWQQTPGLYQGYSGGFGMMLPQVNYQTFGAKFSQLPMELGGSIQGQGSRMSGRPME